MPDLLSPMTILSWQLVSGDGTKLPKEVLLRGALFGQVFGNGISRQWIELLYFKKEKDKIESATQPGDPKETIDFQKFLKEHKPKPSGASGATLNPG